MVNKTPLSSADVLVMVTNDDMEGIVDSIPISTLDGPLPLGVIDVTDAKTFVPTVFAVVVTSINSVSYTHLTLPTSPHV